MVAVLALRLMACEAEPAMADAAHPVPWDPKGVDVMIVCKKPQYRTLDGTSVVVYMDCRVAGTDGVVHQSEGFSPAAEYSRM